MKELFDNPSEPLQLFVRRPDGTMRDQVHHACAHCRVISPSRDDAYDCCRQFRCACGAEMERYRTKCSSCYEAAREEKAEEVPYDGGCVYCERTDRYFNSMGEYLDDTEPGEEAEFLFACDVVRLADASADRIVTGIVEDLISDHHEDAEVDHYDELVAAVGAWLAKQTTESWSPNYKRKVRVPK